MSEGSFAHFLKGAPVLLARGEDDPHSQWLREAGTVALRARNAAEAHERIQDQRVRLFATILDVDMPGADLESFIQAMPAYCALVVMTRNGNAQLLELVQNWNGYFVSTDAPKADFMFAVSAAVSMRGPDLTRLAARASFMWRLPPQQARLLYYNLWSYSDQEIADEMKLSVRTVQQYQEELRKRTGVRTKHAYLRRLLASAGASPPLPMSDETLARLETDKL